MASSLHRTRTRALTAAAATILVGALSGCGAGDDPGDATGQEPTATPTQTATDTGTPTAQPTETPAADGLVINATIRGNDLTPNGERLQAEVGEPITINVDADRAGELHVHSRPEQELAYQAGRTTLELTIDAPGIVEIEDHVADKVLVSLEVS